MSIWYGRNRRDPGISGDFPQQDSNFVSGHPFPVQFRSIPGCGLSFLIPVSVSGTVPGESLARIEFLDTITGSGPVPGEGSVDLFRTTGYGPYPAGSSTVTDL
ncbi:hypothetical protein I4U23_000014 [Adineta vaga]|nr:hypothetical protein I4U23_000014 [Adineta vaga]